MITLRNIFSCLLAITVFTSFAAAQKAPRDNYQKKIDEATPKALPQAPVAEKLKSDAEDEGLKGKVKSVVTEQEDLTGTWSIKGRHLLSVEDYNEKGNLVKQVVYSSGKPFTVSVYGYINGARVSNSEAVSLDGQPVFKISGAASNEKSKTPPDTRYDSKYVYKYEDGKLVEVQGFDNDGRKSMRYVYKYKGNRYEYLVYSADGSLNRKFIYTLDENGNAIERIDVAVLEYQKAAGDTKYTIKYDSFDENGNWTKRVDSRLVKENGKQIYKPWLVTYRTITYHR